MEKLIELNQNKRTIENKVKEKVFENALEALSGLSIFDNFEEIVFKNLTDLYAAVHTCEDEPFICETIRGIDFFLKYNNLEREDSDNKEALEISMFYEKTHINFRLFPEIKGIFKKEKTGRYLILLWEYNPSYGETYEATEGVIELKKRLEKKIKNQIKEDFEMYGKESKDSKKYRFMIEMLKDLPRYVVRSYKKDVDDSSEFLKLLSKN